MGCMISVFLKMVNRGLISDIIYIKIFFFIVIAFMERKIKTKKQQNKKKHYNGSIPFFEPL